jgi:hypothetical protein
VFRGVVKQTAEGIHSNAARSNERAVDFIMVSTLVRYYAKKKEAMGS